MAFVDRTFSGGRFPAFVPGVFWLAVFAVVIGASQAVGGIPVSNCYNLATLSPSQVQRIQQGPSKLIRLGPSLFKKEGNYVLRVNGIEFYPSPKGARHYVTIEPPLVTGNTPGGFEVPQNVRMSYWRGPEYYDFAVELKGTGSIQGSGIMNFYSEQPLDLDGFRKAMIALYGSKEWWQGYGGMIPMGFKVYRGQCYRYYGVPFIRLGYHIRGSNPFDGASSPNFAQDGSIQRFRKEGNRALS